MSDFDDEEGVDEPVLYDDEEEDDADEEVSGKWGCNALAFLFYTCFKASRFLCFLLI
jgi:hypothetical protein